MRFITRFRPSPAMVVACIALLAALAGTGVAAIQLAAPNRVGSAAVIDGSLQKGDFEAGLIVPGKVGARGPAGTAGAAGPAGPSDAYWAVADEKVAVGNSGYTPVATLRLPGAGTYLVWARGISRSSSSPDDVVKCELRAGGTVDTTWRYLAGIASELISSFIVGDFAAGNVTFSCTGASPKVTVGSALVTALKVGNLTPSAG